MTAVWIHGTRTDNDIDNTDLKVLYCGEMGTGVGVAAALACAWRKAPVSFLCLERCLNLWVPADTESPPPERGVRGSLTRTEVR